MKSLIIVFFISALISGCMSYDNTDVIELDFVSNRIVIANGKKFPLQSKSDGGKIIDAFPKATRIRFKNMQNALFSDIWNIVDYDSFCINSRIPLSYEIILSSGKVKKIKFFGRASDPLWMGRIDTQIPISVQSDCELITKELVQDKMTYLQIWCEVHAAKGYDILKIIEIYLSYTNEANEVYLLPY